MAVRILDVIVTFIQQFATTNYVNYLLSCHNWIIKLVRGPVGQTQTGPRTSWQNANWSADQLSWQNANWSADQGRAFCCSNQSPSRAPRAATRAAARAACVSTWLGEGFLDTAQFRRAARPLYCHHVVGLQPTVIASPFARAAPAPRAKRKIRRIVDAHRPSITTRACCRTKFYNL